MQDNGHLNGDDDPLMGDMPVVDAIWVIRCPPGSMASGGAELAFTVFHDAEGARANVETWTRPGDGTFRLSRRFHPVPPDRDDAVRAVGDHVAESCQDDHDRRRRPGQRQACVRGRG